MAEQFEYIYSSRELVVPIEDLQAGDKILLSERRHDEMRPDKSIPTSQVTMMLEGVDESLGQPALRVLTKSRVGESAKGFPKEKPFLIPLDDNGVMPIENGLTIIAFEDSEPTPKKVDGEWSRLIVSRPEERREKATRRLGKGALLPSLFFGFKD